MNSMRRIQLLSVGVIVNSVAAMGASRHLMVLCQDQYDLRARLSGK
jgi:hypothetical protein